MNRNRIFGPVLLMALALPHSAGASSIRELPALQKSVGPSIVELAPLTPARETTSARDGEGRTASIPMLIRGGISGSPARRTAAPQPTANTPVVSSAPSNAASAPAAVRNPE
ncbi:hypothetical protein [Chelativorans sp. M5D2P16]|uniref:hypothetical protein n=1 Tax=Chelativorans sp. M5D2P16 TaxID=3095678 RepID=UPI002ACA976A|nr:hypothetical protein [Chelativorans sp. M5D2P16]MDZ5698863.1 hypothetical protein [Chelativorans sp. M5D2P16]